MEKKVNRFSRFYALLKGNPAADKESLVLQYTDGRTTSLREMSREEYDEMCDALEGSMTHGYKVAKERLRSLRSSVLLRISRLGISTVDNWDGIDAFCCSPRIAGKRFAALTADELTALVPKLESMIRKGGLKKSGAVMTEDREDGHSGMPVCVMFPVSRGKYLN